VTQDEIDQYGEHPMFRPDHMVVGHGLKTGEPTVIFAFVLNDDTHVLAIRPDEADFIAARLRAAAGAVRALQQQEQT